MVVATSDGTKTLVTNGSAGGVIYANGADADGSILKGGAGDDSLRGGKYADDLFGGSGNDSYFGGGGVDNFHVNMQDIKDGVDTDTLLHDADACHRVLLARDARFDGRLFVGVRTTGSSSKCVMSNPAMRVSRSRWSSA